MRREILVVSLGMLLGLGFELQAVNGFTVSCSRSANAEHGWPLAGPIVKFTIKNDVITRCDTIYKAYLAEYPELNLQGTKCVFIRREISPAEANINLDQHYYITTMDINGNNVRDLDTVTGKAGEVGLDWSADYIYYQKGTTIWKIRDGQPSSKSSVFNYTCGIRTFAVSLDATRAAITTSALVNIPHAFPPTSVPAAGCLPSSVTGGCGSYLSPSGKYHQHFWEGGHTQYRINTWNPPCEVLATVDINSRTDFPAWSGITPDSICGQSMEWSRWAVNSDKWICGLVTNMANAQNQILVNWIDRKVILVSKNKPAPALYWNSNDPGDFWLEGGPCGSYEGANGSWVATSVADGCWVIKANSDTLALSATAGGVAPADQPMAFTTRYSPPQGTQFTATASAPWLTVSVNGMQINNHIDITGLASGIYRATVIISAPAIISGSYVVRLRLEGNPVATTLDIAPSSAIIEPNKTAQFSAMVRDQFSDSFATGIIWSVSGGGTIDGNGLFTASASLGDFLVFAIAGNAKDTARAKVTFAKPGLAYKYYQDTMTSVNQIKALAPTQTGVASNFSIDIRKRDSYFAFWFSGVITILKSGQYTFSTGSDDGSNLSIDGTVLVNNDGNHGYQTVSSSVNLTEGDHTIDVLYYQGNGGSGLSVQWKAPGEQQMAAIPNDLLFQSSTVGAFSRDLPLSRATKSTVQILQGDNVLVHVSDANLPALLRVFDMRGVCAFGRIIDKPSLIIKSRELGGAGVYSVQLITRSSTSATRMVFP